MKKTEDLPKMESFHPELIAKKQKKIKEMLKNIDEFGRACG